MPSFIIRAIDPPESGREILTTVAWVFPTRKQTFCLGGLGEFT